MRWKNIYPYLIAAILLFSLIVRLPALDLRPMHGDEAVNAVKFGTLLEHGTYTYDPSEYHGPTLYFFSLPPAFFQSIRTFSNLNEQTLRLVPVILGFLLLAGMLFLIKSVDRPVLIITLLFLAISPANVYYNRYYIHETLLVFFSVALLISIFIYLRSRQTAALILAGIFLGLMVSTKETWIIYLFAICTGFLATFKFKEIIAELRWPPLVIFFSSALFICLLFYTSFFTNPAGLSDAFVSFKNYFSRASANQLHRHSWDYYLSLLIFFKNDPVYFWTEGLLVLFSLTGSILVFRDIMVSANEQPLMRFTAAYTVCLIVVFSIIPYKTPWNLLGFLPGMALLAGFAMLRVYTWLAGKTYRIIYTGILIIAFLHLFWETLQLNFVFPADPLNPYVYAHPLPDVFKIAQSVKDITDHHPQGNNLHIQVVAKDNDYWPLPWYLRKYSRVGWWSEMPGAEALAPLIIINADLESELISRLYVERPPGRQDLYIPLFDQTVFLRPGIEFRAYLKKDDWDLAQQADPGLIQGPQIK